jgi:hypothetical protein
MKLMGELIGTIVLSYGLRVEFKGIFFALNSPAGRA